MEGIVMKYFVLNPTKKDAYGAASCKAMLVYADAIESTNEALAIDIRVWVHKIQHGT